MSRELNHGNFFVKSLFYLRRKCDDIWFWYAVSSSIVEELGKIKINNNSAEHLRKVLDVDLIVLKNKNISHT